MGKRITLSDKPAKEPETFEEWVAVHGEPEYLYETTRKAYKNIRVINCEEDKPPVDPSGVIYEDPKTGKVRINYGRFVDVFAKTNECLYCNGTFYTPQGMVPNFQIRHDISKSLQNFGWKDKLDVPTNSLFASLKDHYSVARLEVDENVIPFANGDLHTSGNIWEFRLGELKHTPYRLPVEFDPNRKPTPLFDKWLHDLFDEADIPTIQEILGYCLVPVTAAQEAFFLVGDGGVGKSVLGVILQGLLGQAHQVITTQELLSQRFLLATVENKLVVYDDDLGSAALTETASLKKLVTADQPIPAERKYGDPYTFESYAKVIACANFMLSALYDDSDGFYRRLHPIKVKPADPQRKTIRDFGKMIVAQEAPQIVNFALDGLRRLKANGWEMTWSDRSREYIGKVKSSGSHFQEFIEACLITNEPASDISYSDLHKLYQRWCDANGVKPVSGKRFADYFRDNSEKYGMSYDRHVLSEGRRVRGYRGAAINPDWLNVTISF